MANTVELTEDPGPPRNDSVNGAQCLTNEAANGLGNGQDYLAPAGPAPYTYPFQIQAGTNSALVSAGITSGSQITSSPSIVSLPIYDSNAVTITPASFGAVPVTVVGFLQVFINSADGSDYRKHKRNRDERGRMQQRCHESPCIRNLSCARTADHAAVI